MNNVDNYWTRRKAGVSRRQLLGAAGAFGAVALVGAGCGDDDDDDDSAPESQDTPSQRTPESQVSTPSAKQPKRGGSLTMRVAADPPNWSVFTASALTVPFANLAYNKLIRLKAGAGVDPSEITLEPDLAQELPELPDPTTLVFTLRPGVKFQNVAPVNGRLMTAEDVKLSIDAYRSDTRSAMKADNATIESVEVVNETTVRVKLKRPMVPLLALSAGHYGWRIIPKEMLEGDQLMTKAIGTGPYIVDSYEASSRGVFRRNPDYFKPDKPYFDKVTLAIIPELASAISAFQTGQIDTLGAVDCTNAEQLRSQKKDAQFQQLLSAEPGGYIAMDTTKPPFSDVRVRRAISMAFNRDAEIAALECGGGKPDQLIPTGAYGKALPIDKLGDASKYWNFDPAAAKALLAEAGFADGFETSMVYTPQYGAAYQSSAERAIQDFAAVGIKVNPKAIQYNEWIGGLYRPPFGFDGILWGPRRYYTDVDPYLWYWLHPDRTQGISNQSRVNDQSIVPLLEKQRETFDEPARLEIIGQIQKIVAEQQYYVGRTTGNSYSFWSPWIEGWGTTLGYDLPQVESSWDGRL
ncbi:MAG: hypothetical protein AMXMBFR80_08220 [Dehalococcoidia bacterium]